MDHPSLQDYFEMLSQLVISGMELSKAVEFFVDDYPGLVSKAAAKWGEYGWVPYLPQDSVYRFITSVDTPSTQEEADLFMLNALEDSTEGLFLSTMKHLYKLGGNQTTYSEAIEAFKSGLYTSCSLDLFALIDSLFIKSQIKKEGGKRRKLSCSAAKQKYNESLAAPYLVIAGATMTIILDLFGTQIDFDPKDEGSGNRNYISHGMNNVIPDRVFCLKLFVLLYNTCLLFASGLFSREEGLDDC